MQRLRRAACLLGLCSAALGAAAQDPGEDKRAREIIAASCFVCHGLEGDSSGAGFPRLAGQHAGYISQQLADFKSGRRKSTTMRPMVEELNAEDLALLGRFFESRTPGVHAIENPALAGLGREVYHKGRPAAGVPACASCHGEAGHGTLTLPRLAGQHALYTENQLKLFMKRERPGDVMPLIATGLSAQEAKAVAAYISGMK